ncbi:MAG: TetR/AcrR family transcriptional regulator [Acidobacteriota bacterium]
MPRRSDPPTPRLAPPQSRHHPQVQPRSQNPTPPTPGAHDRIITAALAEFAQQGFAGARVDRISRKARLNKAMLYYYFGSKARLYRAAIQRVLLGLVDRLEAAADGAGPADAKLDRFIETFVSLGLAEPSVAPIMLREVVEGARHLDKDTFLLLSRVVGIMTAIVRQGQREGVFRDVDPLLTYLTTAWPIVVYLASGPIRASISHYTGLETNLLEPRHFVRHMQEMSRQALAVHPAPAAAPSAANRHTERSS